MIEKYGIYSEFDIDMHRKTFVNYLEVIIDPDGKVMYAVPSHQEKAIAFACSKLGVTRAQIEGMCPPEFYCDFIRWLCIVSGVIAVWNGFCIYDKPTVKQIGTIRQLKMAGLYKGEIPKIPEMCGE